MDNLKYINSRGEEILFLKGNGWYIQNSSNLFSVSHKYEKSNYAEKIRGFSKGIQERDLTLYLCAPKGQYDDIYTRYLNFLRIIEYDIVNATPGKLVSWAGGWLDCFIMAEKLDDVNTKRRNMPFGTYNALKIPLTIVSDDMAWKYSISWEGGDIVSIPVDYAESTEDTYWTHEPIDMIIEINGATSGNAGIEYENAKGEILHYGIDEPLLDDEKLLIDTEEKKIVKIVDGQEINVFDNRVTNGHSVFKPLPAETWNALTNEDIANMKVTYIMRKCGWVWN